MSSYYDTSLPVRACVYGKCGVACSHPLASAAGAEILLSGGNAADAAIAVGAALSVVEPCSNGLGGDLIGLAYVSETKEVTSIMGNGASPANLNVSDFPLQDNTHPSSVTVPGMVKAWEDILKKFGSGTKSLRDVLSPAIKHAREGFPVSPKLSAAWKQYSGSIACHNQESCSLLTKDGVPPKAGEIFTNPDLADVLEEIGTGGDSFYSGDIARKIAAGVRDKGGKLTVEDLHNHATVFEDAISTTYRDVTVHENGAPSHGLAALLALNVTECFDVAKLKAENPSEYLHILIEAVRLSFNETSRILSDPEHHSPADVKSLLEKDFAKGLAAQITTDRSCLQNGGCLKGRGGTVQFCVVDSSGNAFSVVQSTYIGFGSGIIPEGCGFSLNCRGMGFCPPVPDQVHPNSAAGGKRPYHTIISGLLTNSDGTLRAALGCMGSYMQPQGHLQLVCNLIDHEFDSQHAVDALRFRATGPFSACEDDGADEVIFPENLDENHKKELEKRGHIVKISDSVGPFGRAQVITVDQKSKVVCAGSDSRADGIAIVL